MTHYITLIAGYYVETACGKQTDTRRELVTVIVGDVTCERCKQAIKLNGGNCG